MSRVRVYEDEALVYDSAPAQPAGADEGIGSGTVEIGGAWIHLPTAYSVILVNNVPAAREIVISVADGPELMYITVRDPNGAVCQQTPVPIPGGSAPRGPAENIEVARAGQVEASITVPGTYTATVRCTKFAGTETIEAHVN